MTRTEAFRMLTSKEVGIKAGIARAMLDRLDRWAVDARKFSECDPVQYQTSQCFVEVRAAGRRYSVKVTK